MNYENKIDNYFDRVKQNPPLIPIEKVHQLIAEAEVEVKIKAEVKKGHNKLLKFTIMTTIFAVIISAVLLWLNAKEEISNSSSQIPKNSLQVTDQQNTGKAKSDNLYGTDVIKNSIQNKESNQKEDKENLSKKNIETNSQARTELDKIDLGETMVTGNTFVSSDSIQKSIYTYSKLGNQNEAMLQGSFSKNYKNTKYEYYDQKLDSTVFIDINKNELEILGFKLIDNIFTYLFDVRDKKKGFFLSAKGGMSVLMNISEGAAERFNFDKQIVNDSALYKNKAIPMMITNKNGKGSVRWNMPKEWMNELLSSKGEIDIVNLIPVVVKKETFGLLPEEDVVFWFLPTDEFFNRLPQNISDELLVEYDYIIAEDKSQLVKPECKYFDECKNTLELTNFKAYPNPANERVTVSFELPETIGGRISLVDLAGREKQVLHPQSQFAVGSHQLEFDLSSVAEGIYLLTLYSDKGVQTHRLMVVR